MEKEKVAQYEYTTTSKRLDDGLADPARFDLPSRKVNVKNVTANR